MEDKIQINKERYIKIFTNYVKREGVQKLLEMLERTDFFTAPASTKYHCSFEGGLNEHTLNVWDGFIDQLVLKDSILDYGVYEILVKVKKGCELSEDELSRVNDFISVALNDRTVGLPSVVISVLCHDFHKINFYYSYTKKLPNEKTGVWEDRTMYGYRTDNFVLGDSGTNSWYIANQCIKLTYSEILAIENHMGYSSSGHPLPGSSGGWKKSRLALYLHLCDMIATFEKED